MFTPIGYFAPTDGLPSIIKDFVWFYDAAEGSSWTDQSDSGNDGTEQDATGVASITHTAGDTPYWEFATTNGATNNPYVDVGLAPGAQGDFTFIVAFQDTDLTVNANYVWAFDGSLDQLAFGTSRSTDAPYGQIRGTKRVDDLHTDSTISEDTWYFAAFRQDVTANTSDILLNNSELTLDPAYSNYGQATNWNVSANYNIGRGQLVSTQANRFKIGAIGIIYEHLSDEQLTELYDYYNDIYSF